MTPDARTPQLRWKPWVLAIAGVWVLWSVLAAMNPMYSAERMLWPTERVASRIIRDPASTPTTVADRAIAKLEEVVATYPDTRVAAKAKLLIAEVRSARKEHAAARKEFEEVIAGSNTTATQFVDAYKGIARSYLREGNWQKATEMFRELLAKRPADVRVQDVPLQMIVLARQHSADAGEAAIQEAIAHYQRVLETVQKGEVVFAARQRLTTCYTIAVRWEEAAQMFEQLIMGYPQRPELWLWLRGLMEAGTRLNQPDLVQIVAQRYAERYPARRRVVERWLKTRSSAKKTQ